MNRTPPWPYHAEIAAMKGFKPQRKNLYCGVGSAFAATVTSRPRRFEVTLALRR